MEEAEGTGSFQLEIAKGTTKSTLTGPFQGVEENI